MKILRVGDPHVKMDNLEDSDKLIKFIVKICLKHDIKDVEFLGDLFHHHAIKRLEIEHFWLNSLKYLSDNGLRVICLIGNHDQPGSREKEHITALDGFNIKNVSIIKHPTIINNIAYIPYTHNLEFFIKSSQDLCQKGATKTVVSHQTFTGAQYDNGFYAKDSIDPELVSQESIISGHIHTSQQIGKCFFIGTAKWDTRADENKEKGVWIYEHDLDGDIINREFISTKGVVSAIYKYVVNEGDKLPILNESDRNYLELRGKTEWIKRIKKKYFGMANIKGVPVDRKMKKITKNNLNLANFSEDFVPVDGISTKDILKYLQSINAMEV